ncbi:MAG: hypothetical protein V3S55_12040 [Nitrospiraceae bacterium]
MKRILKGLALTALILLCFGNIGAQAEETVRLTNGEWQPFPSKDAPHHGFASFSNDATALGGATRDISSG